MIVQKSWLRVSPATVILAALLMAPLMPSGYIMFYGLGNPLPWKEDVPSAAWFAAAGIIVIELIVVLLVARLLELWLLKKGLIGLLRIRLGTAVLVMITSSLLLSLSLKEMSHGRNGSMRTQLVGWPFSCEFIHYLEQLPEARIGYAWILTLDVLAWLSILAVLTIASERMWRAKERRLIIAPPVETNSAPPPESTLDSLVPSCRERWIYSIPVFLLLGLFPLTMWLPESMAEASDWIKLEFTSLSLFALSAREVLISLPIWGHLLCILALLVPYFGWACNDRNRMIWYSMICLAILLFGAFMVCLAVVLPFFQYPHCVRRGSRIGTSKGDRLIDDLEKGDPITCHDCDGRSKIGRIARVVPGTVEALFRIILEDGRELLITPDHPVGLSSTWLRARSLDIGDHVLTTSGLKRIKDIHADVGHAQVFDITVEPEHNFFANGVLVHNALKRK